MTHTCWALPTFSSFTTRWLFTGEMCARTHTHTQPLQAALMKFKKQISLPDCPEKKGECNDAQHVGPTTPAGP